MKLVHYIGFGIVLSSGGFLLGAATAADVYTDQELQLVVGDQQVIQGEFDSQLTFSKKGLVNIRWLSEDSFLLTALKSGVLIIDPTPISKRQRRYLVKIKTLYQARRDANNLPAHHLISKRKEGILPRHYDPIKAHKFRALLVEHGPGKLIMDCYHPDKQEFVALLKRFHPGMEYGCAAQSYQLHILFAARHDQDTRVTDPRRALERGMPAPAADESLVAKYEWRVDVDPAVTPLHYKMNHDKVGVHIRDLAYESALGAAGKMITFDYELAVDGVITMGHVQKPYELGQQLLLSELVLGMGAKHDFKDLLLEDLPLVGFWLGVRKHKMQRSLWQIWVVMDPAAVGEEAP